ncbi:hypothetical protein [Pantoea sp. SJZ147]|uniref:hypothetical protein n=1 Tax=Pantoea sp. SJZ147 TaxID=2572896 RepID=UPI00119C9AFF|nr:hypothetical protein [Pantoea sp. SJZ147]TWD43888.1 hypothetical protein FBY13_10215 [Pantoea sp. SJZ147]
MLLLMKFLHPYLLFCNLAAWGLAQNIEGLGLFSYINDFPMRVGNQVIYPLNFDPTHGVNVLCGALFFILIPVSLLNIRAGFYLNRRAGWISLCIWVIPGVISLLGYVPDFHNFGPDKFEYGAGFTGSWPSAAANLIIFLIAGWSTIMLFGALWTRDKFKNVYDHFWYVLGLIAALYFVVDSGLPSYKEDLSESSDRITSIMQFYRNGEQNLEALCKDPAVVNRTPDLCSLTSEMKWGFQDSLFSKEIIRARADLPDWVKSVASNPSLKKQIDTFNVIACSSGQIRGNCQVIPFEMSLGEDGYRNSVAFLPPPYAQALQRLHKSMQKADEHVQEIEKGHNARYFVFLLLAFTAGGKLANASRSMVKNDTVRPSSWLLIIIRFVIMKVLWTCRMLVMKIIRPLIKLFFCLLHGKKRVDN